MKTDLERVADYIQRFSELIGVPIDPLDKDGYTQVARGHEPRAQSGALMPTNGSTNGREQPRQPYTPADDQTLARFLVKKFKADWRATAQSPTADLGEFGERVKRASVTWCRERGLEGSGSNRAVNDALDTLRAAVNNEQRKQR